MGDGTAFPGATRAVSDATRLRAGDCVRVYRGTLADTGERARLFVLAPDVPAAATAAFERAATAWERCSEFHGVVPVLARGDTPRHWVAVREVDGRRLPATDLPFEAQRHVLADVAEGLRSAHRKGYYHRGLTPSHVRVVTDSTDATAAAGRLDWALERACLLALDDPPAAYTPPELLAGDGDADPARADVYGLGAVAAETMADTPSGTSPGGDDGTPPTPTPADRSVPGAVDDVVTRALAADPADRYRSVYAFKRALLFETDGDSPADPGSEAGSAAAGDGDTRPVVPDDTGDQRPERDADSRPLVRRRAVLGALGVGAAVTATAGGAWLFGSSGTDGDADGGAGGGDADGAPSEGTGRSRAVPDADFAFALQPLSATVIYEGGDRILAGDLLVRSDAFYGGERAWSTATGTDADRPIREDETVRFAVGGEYEVRVVWTPEESVLASARGPVDPQNPAIGDATTVQYDLGNTGFTPATLPSPPAHERWQFGTENRVESSSAIVDGVLYFGSNDGSVYALDAVTGTELWGSRIGSSVSASPTVARFPGPTDSGRAATRLFLSNAAGTFYSLDAQDGSTRWRTVVGDRSVSSPGVVSLAFDEGPVDTAVVFVGGSDRVTAFDARQGVELWSFEAGRYVSSPAILPPQSARDRTTVFVSSSDETVYALDAHDGSELWSSTVEGVATAPTVARPFEQSGSGSDSIVFLGSGLGGSRGLSALEAVDGDLRWQLTTKRDVISSVAVVDESVSGTAGGTVFAGDSAGFVYAADPRDGTLRWSAETDGGITSPPVVADTSGTEWSDGENTLFLGSWDGNVYGFGTDSGDVTWRFDTGAAVSCSPTVVDGGLYIGNHNGQVYALEERRVKR